MKTLLSALLFTITALDVSAADTLRVLWLGNSLIQSSYSRTGEVTQCSRERATPVYNQYGNYQYDAEQGWTSVPANKELIRTGDWDYVVVQVFGTLGAIFSTYNGHPYDSVVQAMRNWDNLIDSTPAKTIFYLPWTTSGPKPSWDSAAGWWKTPDLLDTALIRLKSLCTEMEAGMFPVGVAQWEVQKRDPSIRLYADWVHCSAQGGYLGGLLCYAMLTGQDPRGMSNFYDLDSQSVFFLQQMAWQYAFRPDIHPFSLPIVKAPTVDRLVLSTRGGAVTVEKYMYVDIIGDLHYTNDSAVTGTNKLLFRSLTPSIMTINHFGRAVAQGVGEARIEAMAGNSLDTITLTVVPSTAQLDSIRIFPRVFVSYVTDQFHFTATGYAFHLGQRVEIDLTTQCGWISGDTAVFTLFNGTVMKKTAQGGPNFAAIAMDGLADTVRFTMLQDLSLLLRLNFQSKDTVYNEFWKGDWGRAYSDSVGYGWVGVPNFDSWTETDKIAYDHELFLVNTALWAKAGPGYGDSVIEGTYKINIHDGDYIVKMCLGHPYYHGNLSYVRCGPNITKKNPDGSDTLFKFQVANNYTTPLYGIKTDTIVVRGEQGIFLNLYGPVMYMVIATSAGVNIDSVAYDKLPLPTSTGISRKNGTEVTSAEISAYPNPFNPEATIILNGGFAGQVRIYSINGQQKAVISPWRVGKSSSEYRWNASCLPSGVYIAEARDKGRSLKKKLILVR